MLLMLNLLNPFSTFSDQAGFISSRKQWLWWIRASSWIRREQGCTTGRDNDVFSLSDFSRFWTPSCLLSGDSLVIRDRNCSRMARLYFLWAVINLIQLWDMSPWHRDHSAKGSRQLVQSSLWRCHKSEEQCSSVIYYTLWSLYENYSVGKLNV